MLINIEKLNRSAGFDPDIPPSLIEYHKKLINYESKLEEPLIER